MTRKEETVADFQSCHLRGSQNHHLRNGGQDCVPSGTWLGLARLSDLTACGLLWGAY